MISNDTGLVVHADWGTSASKRWRATARWDGHRYCIDAPRPVGALPDFVTALLLSEPSRGVLIGLDFPIGIPKAYAAKIQVSDFVAFLGCLGRPPYERFFDVAKEEHEISVRRPFYPYRPGGTSQGQLLSALGLSTVDDLLRQCERASAERGRASPLFWTLGAKQVGKAAICGWRDVICPSLRSLREGVALWPFEGRLAALLASRRCVVAETYPAEACVQLGMSSPGRGWSKAVQSDRVAKGKTIVSRAEERNIVFSSSLRCILSEGFGSGGEGEDQFDAVVGLVAMLLVVLGHRTDGVPEQPTVRNIEGWILGQVAGWPFYR